MTQDELLKLIDEAAADKRPTLDLAGEELSELPSEIGKLTQLKTLILGRWDKENLKFLGNKLRSLPDDITKLSNLQLLDVSYSKLSKLPDSIGQLSNLKSLNVRNNELTLLPNSIGQLSKLQSLDIRNNELNSLPESIGQLSDLQLLDIRNNGLKCLPESTKQLKSLQSLDIRNNELSSLPDGIGQLLKLQLIDISNNKLSNIPESVGQMSSLESFDISSNQLHRIPGSIAHMSSLELLYLSSNRLDRLPESIQQLSNLQSLDISDNQLTSLPEWAKALNKLEKLDLRGNSLPLPPDLLGQKERWREPSAPDEILSAYFSLPKKEISIPLYEAKLILVGEGDAGKTSLAKKIEDESYKLNQDEESTKGINIIQWYFPLDNGNTFRVNIWDFGGQEIYHATHQFFLTKRSLYLLVADNRKENTDFYYWLKVIELLSDSSPVLVIKNEKQDRQCAINEGQFKSQFDNLREYFPTNLENNRGLSEIKDAIRYHISKLPHVGTLLPESWVRVRAALENHTQNSLPTEKYFDICQQNGCTDKTQMLMLSSYLHDLGVCLHFQDDILLERSVILRPEWATAAVYKIADSEIVRSNKGRFSRGDINAIWSEPQYRELRPELLKLMIRFKLAYELPSRSGNTYIAPQLLPLSKPQYDWDTSDNLILRYNYDFMPKGIFTRFIVEIHQLIEYQSHVWKNGVVLKDKWARAEVIENYPKREISVRVSGSNKKHLLETIRHEFWKIHESYELLKYEELIPCNCRQCKNLSTPRFYPYDLLMKYISDQHYYIECRGSYDQVDVRFLISDITDNPAHRFSATHRRKYNLDETQTNLSKTATIGRDINNSVVIIGDNNNADLELTFVAKEIGTLLENFSEEFNATSVKGQNKIKEAVLTEIKRKPPLKARIIKAIQAFGEQALIEAVDHPVDEVVLKGISNYFEN